MKSLNEFLNEAKDVGHYVPAGNQTIVDSNFVNYSKGCLPDSELVHLGMGDFELKTPKGNITFSRTGKIVGIGQDFVGRPHRATDNKGGKVLEELIKVMTKKKKAVLSMSGMDESKKKLISQFKPGDKIKTQEGKKKVIKDIDIFPDYVGVFFDDDSYERYHKDSVLDEAKKPVTDKYGWHIKPFFKEGEKVLYYGEPAVITKVRDKSSKVTYDVRYTKDDRPMFQAFVGNKSGEIKKLNEINQYTGEAEKPEKYWDTKFKKAIKLFPTWADEKVDITNEIRKVYNEMILDVIKGDKGYVKPISKYEGDVEVYIEMATDLWNKMKGNVIAKEMALEDYVRWLK